MKEEIDTRADQRHTATDNQGDTKMGGNRWHHPCYHLDNKNGGDRDKEEERNDHAHTSIKEGTSGMTGIRDQIEPYLRCMRDRLPSHTHKYGIKHIITRMMNVLLQNKLETLLATKGDCIE